MAKFCVHCGAALPPEARVGAVITCPACGKALHDPLAVRAAGAAAEKPGLPRLAWALIVLAGAPVLCAVFGIVAAIAIPNFIRFGARSKQAECKATLTRLATAQQRHRVAKGAFATTFDALAFSAPPGNRYAYVLGSGEGQRLEPSPRMGPPGLSTAELERANAGADAYTALCIANIDNDEGVDVWGVSSTAQRDATGAEVAAGTPFVLVDDVSVFP